MKQLGKVLEDKDIPNKEYVDSQFEELALSKLELSDLSELSNACILELWNQLIT